MATTLVLFFFFFSCSVSGVSSRFSRGCCRLTRVQWRDPVVEDTNPLLVCSSRCLFVCVELRTLPPLSSMLPPECTQDFFFFNFFCGCGGGESRISTLYCLSCLDLPATCLPGVFFCGSSSVAVLSRFSVCSCSLSPGSVLSCPHV